MAMPLPSACEVSCRARGWKSSSATAITAADKPRSAKVRARWVPRSTALDAVDSAYIELSLP